MGFQRLGIDLQRIDEGIDGAVRAPVQEVVQTAIVLAWQIARCGHPPILSTPPEKPANGDRDKKKDEYQVIIHRL